MKEHLHLFTRISEAQERQRYPLAYNEFNNWVFEPNRHFEKYGDLWYDKDGKRATHVLDLSRLTTKEIKQESKDAFFEDWKYCIPLEISRDGSYDEVSGTFEVMNGLDEFKKAIDQL